MVFIYLTVFSGFKEERNESQTMKYIHAHDHQDNKVKVGLVAYQNINIININANNFAS